jgi:hypothetical protein
MHVVNVEAAIVDGDRYLMIIRGENEIRSLPDALFSPPQPDEQWCDRSHSTARFLMLASHQETFLYGRPMSITRMSLFPGLEGYARWAITLSTRWRKTS